MQKILARKILFSRRYGDRIFSKLTKLSKVEYTGTCSRPRYEVSRFSKHLPVPPYEVSYRIGASG